MRNILQTKNLQKYFAKQTIIDNISINVPTNSIYALLGVNGSGKTTFLKIITGLLRYDSGEITIFGEIWQPSCLRHIGTLIEAPALYTNLTAYENLLIQCKLCQLPSIEIYRVLEMVQLTDTDKKLVRQFSLGMKQRLGIAIALLGQPKLLILDEPSNGLDPLAIQQLRRLIHSLPALGISVILTSHVLTEVVQLADHVGIINEGKLLYETQITSKTDLETLFLNILTGSV